MRRLAVSTRGLRTALTRCEPRGLLPRLSCQLRVEMAALCTAPMSRGPHYERSNDPLITGGASTLTELRQRIRNDAPQLMASRYRIQERSEEAEVANASAKRPRRIMPEGKQIPTASLTLLTSLTRLDQAQKLSRSVLDADRQDTMRRLHALLEYGTSHAYEAALHHMGTTGRFKCAFRILAAMEERGVPIETRHYAHAVHACASARQLENALELLAHVEVRYKHASPGSVDYSLEGCMCLRAFASASPFACAYVRAPARACAFLRLRSFLRLLLRVCVRVSVSVCLCLCARSDTRALS